MVAFVPVAAIGRAIPDDEDRRDPASAFRRWAMIHDPAEPCRRCGRPVVISYRSTNRTKHQVYCTRACRDAVIAASAPRPPAPPVPARPRRCPRPDKLVFTDEAAASAWFADLLVVEPGFNVYRCVCGAWHGGRYDTAPDAGQTIGAIARIVNAPEGS